MWEYCDFTKLFRTSSPDTIREHLPPATTLVNLTSNAGALEHKPATSTINCTVSGTIADSSGAVVPNAEIKAINVTTAETRSAISSSNGTYLVPLLLPGTYRVEASKSGFKLSVSADVPVHITETVAVDLRLAVGTAAETVMVTANSELLKTEGIALGQVVDEREVNSLPLVSRNYTEILGRSPGVSM